MILYDKLMITCFINYGPKILRKYGMLIAEIEKEMLYKAENVQCEEEDIFHQIIWRILVDSGVLARDFPSV